MAKTINLQYMRDALENKYGHTIVALSDTESVTLLNPNRLDEKKRDKVVGFADVMEGVDKDDIKAQENLVRELLLTVAESDAAGKKLMKAIDAVPGDSLLLLMDLLSEYMGDQGEASPSES